MWRQLVVAACATLIIATQTTWADNVTPVLPAAVSSLPPRVVVVLGGGGAKGFAHLAVLRRLEQDGIPIHRIVGTSMGAVVGGLYASGRSVDEIERIIGQLDPSRVALDHVGREELPPRRRAYEAQYPIGIELGLRDGHVGLARGISDGQRFLDLLQRLTSNVVPGGHFDALRVPFRAVATRYRDGEIHVFDRGALHLAIRASMAAPGVFAPVEIDGETYVDGGLVANLPVEVALREGADLIVVSQPVEADDDNGTATNGFTVAGRMLSILIRQNVQRNLQAMRPQDILVRTTLTDVGFADFGKVATAVAAGESAVREQQARFAALAKLIGSGRTASGRNPACDQREVVISQVRVTGGRNVPEHYVRRSLSDLVGTEFNADVVGRRIDMLYTEGHFERLSYELKPLASGRYELIVDTQEKPHGPHYFRPMLSVFSDTGGNHLYSLGAGYRRPFLTESGAELQGNLRVGSDSELSMRMFQPLRLGLGLGAEFGVSQQQQPIYNSPSNKKIALGSLRRQVLAADLGLDVGRHSTVRLAWVNADVRARLETEPLIFGADDDGTPLENGVRYKYSGVRLNWVTDQLDSATFPTRGYLARLSLERGVTGAKFSSYRANFAWASHWGEHILVAGLSAGAERAPRCEADCRQPNNLYLGGFQAMGAYQNAQLAGDRMAHAHLTYMRRLGDGGLLRQPSFSGVVLEAGDAWTSPGRPNVRYSATAFVGIDSRIGDIYIGVARGSGGNANAFLQFGRRFTYW